MRFIRFFVLALFAGAFWLTLLAGPAGAQTGYGDDVAPPRFLGVQIDDDAGGGGDGGGVSGTTALVVGGVAALAALGGAAVYASGGVGALRLPWRH